MATPSSSSVVPTIITTMSPPTTAPRPRVIVLPNELVGKILSDSGIDRATLRSVMRCNHDMFDQAVRLYWRLVDPSNHLLKMLVKVPLLSRQQRYADEIVSFHDRLSPLALLPPVHQLRFPKLKELSMIYDGHQPRSHAPHAPAGCHIAIGHLMTPGLKVLEVSKMVGVLGRFSTGNFLPHLASNSKGLKSLVIGADIMSASPGCLIRVIDECAELEGLGIRDEAEALIDDQTLKHVAAHPRLECFGTHRLITVADVNIALSNNSPSPFARLLWVHLVIETQAAILMVPRMPKLVRLELRVSGAGNIFTHLDKLENLQALNLIFNTAYTLRNDDLDALIRHTRLRELVLNYSLSSQLNASSVSVATILRVFAALPDLTNFRIRAIHLWDVDFILGLSHTCPSLESLELSGTYDLTALESVNKPLFPRIEYLAIEAINDIGGGGNTEQRAKRVVTLIDRHAPKLKEFICPGTVFSRQVQHEWQKN